MANPKPATTKLRGMEGSIPSPDLSQQTLAEFFGPVPAWLPATIGQVVMLSALLEQRVEGLAALLSCRDQSEVAGQAFSESVRTCRNALDRLGTAGAPEIVEARRVLTDIEKTIGRRNVVVHAVWRRTDAESLKTAQHIRSKQRPASSEWLAWEHWSRERLEELVDDLVAALRAIRPILGRSGSWATYLTRA